MKYRLRYTREQYRGIFYSGHDGYNRQHYEELFDAQTDEEACKKVRDFICLCLNSNNFSSSYFKPVRFERIDQEEITTEIHFSIPLRDYT